MYEKCIGELHLTHVTCYCTLIERYFASHMEHLASSLCIYNNH